MLSTGLTRGQIRAGLEATAKADRQERERNIESRPVSETFRQNSELQQLRPAPFDTSSKSGARSGQGAGPTEEYYVVINGTLYTQGFVVSGDPEVV